MANTPIKTKAQFIARLNSMIRKFSTAKSFPEREAIYRDESRAIMMACFDGLPGEAEGPGPQDGIEQTVPAEPGIAA